MGELYYITKEQLIELTIDSLKLTALEGNGVCNWEWYSDSLWDFLKEEQAESFRELAEDVVQANYNEV